MYYLMIVLLMGVLPVASVLIEQAIGHGDWLALIGRWFVFWAGGVRLLLAGARQIGNPAFTARTIFEIEDAGVSRIVVELGFANVAMGLIGIASILRPDWVLPAAIVTGLYYGLAGLRHIANSGRNRIETWATVSDLWAFVVLAAYAATTLARGG
jgi:hypothetical protein